MSFRLIISIISLLAVLTSCSGSKVTGKTAAEKLFKEAQELQEEGRYLLALEKLGQLRSEHPYSYFATSAELMMADIYFAQENYKEAAAAYQLFRDYHPKHKLMSYVVWKLAESYYFQLPRTFDRDLSPAFEAIKYYDELLARYPDSKYNKDSQEKKNSAREMLKSKDRYIADFYFKTGSYKSARFRYLDIIDKWDDTNLRIHSVFRIVESSLYMESYPECVKYGNKYVDFLSDQKSKDRMKNIIGDCQQELAASEEQNKDS